MREILAIATLISAIVLGCSHREEADHEHHGQHRHKAPHGGALNAIEKCALGHVEAVLEGKKLTLYFVGGHDKTETSLPIKAEKFELRVTLEDGSEKLIELIAKPLKLAGEKVGNCSRFEGEGDFLEGVERFEATGRVEVNGVMRTLTIKYPEGFHPDHDEREHHEHEYHGGDH